jgi:hypothetical protein
LTTIYRFRHMWFENFVTRFIFSFIRWLVSQQ